MWAILKGAGHGRVWIISFYSRFSSWLSTKPQQINLNNASIIELIEMLSFHKNVTLRGFDILDILLMKLLYFFREIDRMDL